MFKQTTVTYVPEHLLPISPVCTGKEARGSSTVNEPKEQFTGKERDSESGLDYFGARYYNSEIGRWVSADPLKQYASPYVYVGNNPIRMIDPTGLFATDGDDGSSFKKAKWTTQKGSSEWNSPSDEGYPGGDEESKNSNKDSERDFGGGVIADGGENSGGQTGNSNNSNTSGGDGSTPAGPGMALAIKLLVFGKVADAATPSYLTISIGGTAMYGLGFGYSGSLNLLKRGPYSGTEVPSLTITQGGGSASLGRAISIGATWSFDPKQVVSPSTVEVNQTAGQTGFYVDMGCVRAEYMPYGSKTAGISLQYPPSYGAGITNTYIK